MGLTIFYSGQLRSPQLQSSLIEEAIDLCDSLGWHYEPYPTMSNLPIEGILLYPPQCEPVWLTFLPDGNLSNPQSYVFRNNPKTKKLPGDETDRNSTITQWGGPEVHIALINMLKYLTAKYFKHFNLIDESEYWESGNVEKCKDWFNMFAIWMKNMSVDLGALDGRGHETGENFQSRVEDLLNGGKSMMDILNVMGDPYRK